VTTETHQEPIEDQELAVEEEAEGEAAEADTSEDEAEGD